MNTPTIAPTISMQTVQHADGSWGVNVYLTGLASEGHADKAMEYVAQQLCGAEIKEQ